VIAPHRGDEQVVRDMPFDDTDADANLGRGTQRARFAVRSAAAGGRVTRDVAAQRD
jgi:hypothetical protein